jgi:hypothetical protein
MRMHLPVACHVFECSHVGMSVYGIGWYWVSHCGTTLKHLHVPRRHGNALVDAWCVQHALDTMGVVCMGALPPYHVSCAAAAAAAAARSRRDGSAVSSYLC